ncbi:hypothetical protein chiPu_0018949 [Chiloscyllium punctatum]|uniref:Reverse transcriptase domain-containing protein n=1 Tax=Chiloscyllium punctatum TaxID=137246 RepID=A0A401RRB8_CHIPU|nr:hypothetical protein [Chiloscyllium punctatum]
MGVPTSSACPLLEINPSQKEFIAATPGCNENIVILENIIKGAKHNRKDFAVVFVDLAKAFDSVGHKLLIKSLQRVKLSKAFVSLIEDLYTGNTTVVEGNGNLTTPITIERGVKQGDPLSPILFNIALDPLYGWTSWVEPRLFAKDGSLWKPDLIFRKEQKIAVVDVTVWYENDSKALETAWREKQEKYKHLNAEVTELTGGMDPKYFGFVMGARGKWLGMNNRLIKFLGIERYDTFAQKTSRLTLSLTLELLQLISDK